MEVDELIEFLKDLKKKNAKIGKAKIEVEYKGSGGCETCGYGSEVTADIEKSRIYNLETRVVISV